MDVRRADDALKWLVARVGRIVTDHRPAAVMRVAIVGIAVFVCGGDPHDTCRGCNRRGEDEERRTRPTKRREAVRGRAFHHSILQVSLSDRSIALDRVRLPGDLANKRLLMQEAICPSFLGLGPGSPRTEGLRTD